MTSHLIPLPSIHWKCLLILAGVTGVRWLFSSSCSASTSKRDDVLPGVPPKGPAVPPCIPPMKWFCGEGPPDRPMLDWVKRLNMVEELSAGAAAPDNTNASTSNSFPTCMGGLPPGSPSRSMAGVPFFFFPSLLLPSQEKKNQRETETTNSQSNVSRLGPLRSSRPIVGTRTSSCTGTCSWSSGMSAGSGTSPPNSLFRSPVLPVSACHSTSTPFPVQFTTASLSRWGPLPGSTIVLFLLVWSQHAEAQHILHGQSQSLPFQLVVSLQIPPSPRKSIKCQ